MSNKQFIVTIAASIVLSACQIQPSITAAIDISRLPKSSQWNDIGEGVYYCNVNDYSGTKDSRVWTFEVIRRTGGIERAFIVTDNQTTTSRTEIFTSNSFLPNFDYNLYENTNYTLTYQSIVNYVLVADALPSLYTISSLQYIPGYPVNFYNEPRALGNPYISFDMTLPQGHYEGAQNPRQPTKLRHFDCFRQQYNNTVNSI